MANKNQEYTEQYADYAMEQMRRYGIPASVTLAQGILESSNGQSRLAQNENNHFGIKATPEWIAEGGRYSLYSDDKPNEKFCSYDSVGDSYEHHSRFLKENNRYARCFSLSPDDNKGWTLGLEKAGYAVPPHLFHRIVCILFRIFLILVCHISTSSWLDVVRSLRRLFLQARFAVPWTYRHNPSRMPVAHEFAALFPHCHARIPI